MQKWGPVYYQGFSSPTLFYAYFSRTFSEGVVYNNWFFVEACCGAVTTRLNVWRSLPIQKWCLNNVFISANNPLYTNNTSIEISFHVSINSPFPSSPMSAETSSFAIHHSHIATPFFDAQSLRSKRQVLDVTTKYRTNFSYQNTMSMYDEFDTYWESEDAASPTVRHFASSADIVKRFITGELKYALEGLQDPLMIGIDLEWEEAKGKGDNITEVGIAVVDLKEVQTSGNRTEDILRSMKVHHIRVKEHAHVVNGYCSVHPDKFEFGHSRFMDLKGTGTFIEKLFTTDRPIIFVGHAVGNDISKLSQTFNIDTGRFENITRTVDTQALANEMGIYGRGQVISLTNLLAHHNISERFLHNAGNDIACTVIAALLTVSSDKLPNNQEFVGELKNTAKAQKPPTYGSGIMCTRCLSGSHEKRRCKQRVKCTSCENDPNRRAKAHTHATHECGFAKGRKAPAMKSVHEPNIPDPW